MISDFFIARPVLANVLAILIMVVGGVALFTLPVAQYPDVVPPTVQVTTRYPGASARTVIDAVALPIEQQVNGVEGMIYMQSFSGADGSYSLTVTFGVGADLNQSQVLVQNRVSSALALLPQAVQAQGVVVQKNSTAILQIVTLTSPDARYDSLYLANYATIRLKDEIARLPGVGNVNVFGAGQYSMRVWLDPEKMRARSLVPQDVVQALQQQSSRVTAGQIGMPPAPAGQSFQYTLNVAGKLSDPDEFGAIIVKTGRSGEVTRLRDVGRVELGAQTYGQVFTLDGKPAAGLAVFQAPGANALQVATEVRKKMAELAREFPPGLISDIPFDTTTFVRQSIHEVYKTLIEAAILVLLVIPSSCRIGAPCWYPARPCRSPSSAPSQPWRPSVSPSIFRPCSRSCSPSASSSTMPSWWSKAQFITSSRACPAARRRAAPCARSLGRSSALRSCSCRCSCRRRSCPV